MPAALTQQVKPQLAASLLASACWKCCTAGQGLQGRQVQQPPAPPLPCSQLPTLPAGHSRRPSSTASCRLQTLTTQCCQREGWPAACHPVLAEQAMLVGTARVQGQHGCCLSRQAPGSRQGPSRPPGPWPSSGRRQGSRGRQLVVVGQQRPCQKLAYLRPCRSAVQRQAGHPSGQGSRASLKVVAGQWQQELQALAQQLQHHCSSLVPRQAGDWAQAGARLCPSALATSRDLPMLLLLVVVARLGRRQCICLLQCSSGLGSAWQHAAMQQQQRCHRLSTAPRQASSQVASNPGGSSLSLARDCQRVSAV